MDQLCFALLWHWTPESWDTLVTSRRLGSASAQDLVGNRTTTGLINKPCDSIHTTSYALDPMFVLAVGKKKVTDKLTLSWVEDRVMDLFVLTHRLTIPGKEMGLVICKKSVNFNSQLPRNTLLAAQKRDTPLGQTALFLIRFGRLCWITIVMLSWMCWPKENCKAFCIEKL